MVSKPNLQAQRFVQLVHELGDDLGKKRGWKQAVAQKLDIHPSYLSKILRGDFRSISDEATARAARRLGIEPSFFTDAQVRSYVEYLKGDKIQVLRPPFPSSYGIALEGSVPTEDIVELLDRAARIEDGRESSDGPEGRAFALAVKRWIEAVQQHVGGLNAPAMEALTGPDVEVKGRVRALAWFLLTIVEKSPAFVAPPRHRGRR